MSYRQFSACAFFLSTLIVFAFTASVSAEEPMAKLFSVEGVVETRPEGQQAWQTATVGDAFNSGDAVRVGEYGRAGVLFSDGVLVRLSSRASLTLGERTEKKHHLKVDSGKAYFHSRKPRRYPEVKTPVVSASVRGTEFVVSVTAERTDIHLISGLLRAANTQGSVDVQSGETATARAGEAPQKGILIEPGEAVQWALHYPPVVESKDFAGAYLGTGSSEQHVAAWEEFQKGNVGVASALLSGTSWRDYFGQALLGLAQSDVPRTLSALERAFQAAGKDEAGKAASDLLSSSVLLSVGQVAEANERLGRLRPEGLDPTLQAMFYAQTAIVHLTQNRIEEAHAAASAALEAEQASVSALLAASYVAQARGNLAGAQAILTRAHEDRPENAFIAARAAEIELAFGDISSAEELSKKALRAPGANAYAELISGFVKLFRGEKDAARKAFQYAAAANSSDPMPRFGLGLVSANDGDLLESRAHFQMAIALSPRMSILRSYLGKAFFEDGAEDLAAKEYELAIEMDPNDPTPYLYRSFNSLSQNKPVAALRDVESAIEKNDNRAVYRSRLLLDRDLGVRSAALSEVFNDLGFSKAAKIEAIKSINEDYTNYSAHRLLAESLQTIFTAESALSEERVASLLAPLSFNLFRSLGGEATLNEYNALFDKDEERSEVGVRYGSFQDSYLVEGVTAGKDEDLGYALRASSAFENGTKSNNFAREYRFSAALQKQYTFRDRVILEASTQVNEAKTGFGMQESQIIEPFRLNFGYHRRVSNKARFIGEIEVLRENTDRTVFDGRVIDVVEGIPGGAALWEDVGVFLREQSDFDERLFRHGSQYSYNSDVFDFVAGAELDWVRSAANEMSPILEGDIPFFADINRRLTSEQQNTLHGETFYFYSTTHLSQYADLNLGASLESVGFEKVGVPPYFDGRVDRQRVNPKFGLLLYPVPEVTLRAAYFEELGRSALIDLASLEPTLVGGLTQRFIDPPGSRSQNYGFGADVKLAGSTYFGAQWLRRDIREDEVLTMQRYLIDFAGLAESSPVSLGAESMVYREQDVLSAYLYQVLCDEGVFTVDYDYFMDNDNAPLSAIRSDLHRTKFGMRYFDPSGVFLFSEATWREQTRWNSPFVGDGSNDFWLVDIGVGYRLPRQQGTVTLTAKNVGDKKFVYDQSSGFEPTLPDNGVSVLLAGAVNF